MAPEELSATRSELQLINKFHVALLGIAGHDLRQPLQVIQNTYDLLRARALGPREQALLANGEQAISRLNEQLDRLLGALRFYEQTKTVEISSVALAPLLWRLANENEEAALRRGIDLRVRSTGVFVKSNAVLLASILRNLLTNSVKYTEPGGRILVGCRQAGSDVRIDVYDTGIGIDATQLLRISDAFERGHADRCDGLGIGLFVVRRALEVLGHRIEIRSALAQGSRFSVFVPRADSMQNDCAGPARPEVRIGIEPTAKISAARSCRS
jgi:two-component system, OmpR family, phosphate regulon sensor histidine kinase PhoR